MRQCLFVAFLTLPLCAQTIPESSWETFSSKVGGYSVQMPGEPRESFSVPQSSAFDENVKAYAASLGVAAGYFAIVERIYPHELETDASANLDRFQPFAVKAAHATVVKQENTPIKGLTARRLWLIFQVRGTPYDEQQLLLIKANRLFQLIVLKGSAGLDDKDINRFIDSFSVTDAPDLGQPFAQCSDTAKMKVYSDARYVEDAGDVIGHELALAEDSKPAVQGLFFDYEGAPNREGMELTGNKSGKTLTLQGTWVLETLDSSGKINAERHPVRLELTETSSGELRGKVTMQHRSEAVRLRRAPQIWLCRNTTASR